MTDGNRPADAPSTEASAATTGPVAPAGPESAQIEEIRAGYAFEGAALDFGAAVVEDQAYPDARVRIPLGCSTGTG